MSWQPWNPDSWQNSEITLDPETYVYPINIIKSQNIKLRETEVRSYALLKNGLYLHIKEIFQSFLCILN